MNTHLRQAAIQLFDLQVWLEDKAKTDNQKIIFTQPGENQAKDEESLNNTGAICIREFHLPGTGWFREWAIPRS